MDTKPLKTLYVRAKYIIAILAVALLVAGSSAGRVQGLAEAGGLFPGDWDGTAVLKSSVVKEPDGYKMWYDGVDFFNQTQIGLATSDDGTSWMKYSDNPVLTGDPEAWDSSGEHAPFVIKEGDLYKMWYEGSDGDVRQLGYATSPDGVQWTKYAENPVLQAGPEGYDESVAGHGSVLFEDGLYKLWYHAIGDQGVIIAYATSPDGVNWTKEGPVLMPEEGGWELGLWGPSVLKIEDTYWMWYSAHSPYYPASIGVATSPDGAEWTRVGDGPVITHPDNYLGDPQVIFDGGIFKMWYTNFSDGAIYSVESVDGISWGDPVLALSPGALPLLWRDEFDESLSEDWYWVNENSDNWNLTEEPGFLRIYASPFVTGGENLLLKPVDQGDFVIKTRLIFEPDTNFQFAGLVIWQDESNFLQFGRAFCDVPDACVGNGIYFDHIGDGTLVDGNFATPVDSSNEAYLRLERRGEMVRALYSDDGGISWYEFGTHWIPAEFQVNGVGLTSSQDYNTPDWDIPADFDFFELTEGWGFLPEGFHDFDQGDVPTWACNAGGWAVDPDDRAFHVNVEVIVDHQTIATPVAEEFRQDLLDAGLCVDGNCGFFAPMWGLISSYEPHSVATWAQDFPSGEWVLLSSSPKTLTCRTYDIYAYDPLTSETQQITDMKDSDEYNPSWSPNGKMVAYNVVNSDETVGIHLTDLKTGVSASLAGAEGGGGAVWSPNGKWIAFDRLGVGDSSLYLVPSEGGIPALVRSDAISADWAPNGKRLVFKQPSDGSIRTVPVDGGRGGETLIAEDGANPVWSPDGNWIAYDKDGDIWKVQVNVQGTLFGEPIQVTSLVAGDGHPTWSADSQWIVFHSGLSRDYDLWTVPAEGGEPIWLTGAPEFGDYDPAYARNSSNVAYASFSPQGQMARGWISAYTYDLPPGSLADGTYPYHFEFEWSAPEPGAFSGQGGEFVISNETPIHGGYVLLRGFRALRGMDTPEGLVCEEVGEINPDQPIRFLVGWVTDSEMTYPEGWAHFDSLTARAVWGDGMSVDLVRHEIFPRSSEVDFAGYMCTFTEAPPRMDLRVNYGHDWVESFYEAGHEVVITLTEGDGETVKATATIITEPKDFWGGETGFQTIPEDWSPGPPDLGPYDWIYAQVDNGVTAQVQLGDISGAIDLEADSIEGTVNASWFSNELEVDCHSWGAPLPEEILKYDTVLPDGEDTYFCSWAGEWDIQPGQDVGVGYSGLDGHWVANAFFVPNPHFTVFPEWEYLEGYEWPDGALVSISVDGKEVCSISATAGYPEWDPNNTFLGVNFPEGCDLAVGDVVTASDGVTTRMHTIRNLAISSVDEVAETVEGTSDPGEMIYVWPHETGQQIETAADEYGSWLADFNGIFNIQPGSGGRSEIRDDAGNATAVDWYVPNPHFTVFPLWEWYDAMDWPEGATVNITVEGKSQCDFQKVSLGNFFNGGFPAGCDIAAGDTVTFTDNGTTRTHVVRNLTITGIDLGENTISGLADAGTTVYVWPHDAWFEPLQAIANDQGEWQVDLDDVGYDILEGASGRSEIRDDMGNATAVDWNLNARLIVHTTDDWFRAEGFMPNTSLDFWIYDSIDGTLLLESTTAQTDSGGTITHWVGGDQMDIVPGNYVIVSDGTSTRELVLEALTFDVFDTALGILQGTAPEPFGRTVSVGVGCWARDDLTMDVTADENGGWIVDFGVSIPDDYGCVFAWVYDVDGDVSEARPERVVGLWAAALTYDLPAGTLTDGTYPYHFELEWSLPEPGSFSGQGGELVISSDAPIYDGYVLLRGPMELRRVGSPESPVCEEVSEINPEQPMRFLIGWVPDPMTYEEALDFFERLSGIAVWDENETSAELSRHEIGPFSWDDLDSWFQYVCTFTE